MLENVRQILVGLSIAVTVTACDQPTATSTRTNDVAQNISADLPRWLPVGTKVPVGVAINAPPEPYDPAKHGPALTDSRTEANLAGRPSIDRPKRRRSASGDYMPPPGTGDRGFYLTQATRAWYGASAMYDLNLNLQLPTPWGGHDVSVYAPTMMPPGGTCLEVTQVYHRESDGSTTGKFFGIWDWCESGEDGEFDVFDQQVTTWTNRYVRTYQGKPMYAVSIVTPNTGSTMGQCWYANIYDYLAGGWVQKLARCGQPQHGWGNTGWTMWESVFLTNGACPTLPSIRSLDIMLYDPNSGTPTPFTNWPSDNVQLGPYGTCWPSGPYTFVSPVPGVAANSWRGNTPNP